MSYSKYKQTWLGPKGIEQQILNSIFTTHDIGCGCPDPPTHIITLLAPLIKPQNLSTEEKQALKKCLSDLTGEDTATGTIENLDVGDLEHLFAENADDLGEG